MPNIVKLQPDLRVECTADTGYQFITDGPKSIQGIGEAFPPTDLVGVSLASCILTMMGNVANRMKIDIIGTSATVDKKMDATFSKLTHLDVAVTLPHSFDESTMTRLKQAAASCPVHHSLHPDITINVTFLFNE